MNKRVLGILSLLAGLGLTSSRLIITGNSVRDSFQGFNLSINLIGLILLVGSLLILVSNKTLDYVVVPDSGGEWEKQRLKRLLKEKESGRKIKNMYWLQGADSEEDILLLGKKVKPGERIGIDTFPLHYLEYKELIKKAQRDGKFPKKVKLENLGTEQGIKEWIYGTLGLIEEIFKRRKLGYKKDRDEKYLEAIKKLGHKIID
jgi:hypothetical protein